VQHPGVPGILLGFRRDREYRVRRESAVSGEGGDVGIQLVFKYLFPNTKRFGSSRKSYCKYKTFRQFKWFKMSYILEHY
jgi:hypothetical protein